LFKNNRDDQTIINILKGTTTVGAVFKDFTVLAADRRATSGHFIAHKKARKIYKIDEHAAVTIAGAVGDAQWLVNQLKIEAASYRVSTGDPINIKSLATLASIILFRFRPMLIVQMLIGGYDNEGSQLYGIDWLGTVTKERYTATGSGTQYAISILENEYREDLSVENAVKLVVRAVRAAMHRDPGSGEGVDVAVILSKGVKFIKGEEIKIEK